MQWATEEEARTHAREIETLKADIRRLNVLRDESLESQRRDLTTTFENILHLREEGFAQKEQEIAKQVNLLEGRFESLQTENTRLKSDLAASLRQRDALTEELAGKEEARRQLQWSLENAHQAKLQADTAHAHAIQQLTLELSMLKENSGNDVSDLKRKLTAVSAPHVAVCFYWYAALSIADRDTRLLLPVL